MNAENFAEIIKNPSQLYQFSYQELKSLVMQYPYCQNLQFLLLIKSFLDHHKDYNKVLARTATLSIDRQHLYQVLKKMETLQEAEDNFELGEEFLELKDISNLEAELEGITLSSDDEKEADESGSRIVEPEPFFPEPEAREQSMPEVEEPPVVPGAEPLVQGAGSNDQVGSIPEAEESAGIPEFSERVPERIVGDLAAMISIINQLEEERPPEKIPVSPQEEEPVAGAVQPEAAEKSAAEGAHKEGAPAAPAPKPKSAFHSWSAKPQPPVIKFSPEEIAGKSPRPKTPAGKKTKKKKEDPVIEFAERSLREQEEIATETLADLLVQQERYDKAIQMYKRLILIFPEKSTFFAEKIEELKKLR